MPTFIIPVVRTVQETVQIESETLLGAILEAVGTGKLDGSEKILVKYGDLWKPIEIKQ